MNNKQRYEAMPDENKGSINNRPEQIPEQAEWLTMTPEREAALKRRGYRRNRLPFRTGYRQIATGEGWIRPKRNGEGWEQMSDERALSELHGLEMLEKEVKQQ